jgi:hypothetical protein
VPICHPPSGRLVHAHHVLACRGASAECRHVMQTSTTALAKPARGTGTFINFKICSSPRSRASASGGPR